MKAYFIVLALMAPATLLGADANPDGSFYEKAAQGNMAEVELGQLAQQKSHDPSIKEFGAMMIKDHSAANDKLKAIAAAKDLKLPSGPSIGQRAIKTKLELLSGESFDKSYVRGMIKDHEEDIEEFQMEVDSGRDADAKAYAAATLPTLRAHLKKIRSIAAKAEPSATQ